MVANNDIILYRSPRLAQELSNVLERPKFKKYFPNGIQHLILFFELTTRLYHTIDIFSDCADPKDNYLFDLAYQANTRYLVSGDHHVLETPVKNTLKVVSLTDFIKSINYS
jgi:putative PIN family toxin of toxin-antitoxin system